MFEKVKNAIDIYNNISLNARPPYPQIGLISTGQKSTIPEITILETAANINVPEDLKHFYTEIGSLNCDPFNENNSIEVFSVNKLLASLQTSDTCQRTSSLGLIDMIKLNWANDRYEFDEELDSDFRKTINTNYFCFGWYFTNDNLESAYYLYFDNAGKFGKVFYHQDAFDELIEDYLAPLASASVTTMTLEEILVESLGLITSLKIEEVK